LEYRCGPVTVSGRVFEVVAIFGRSFTPFGEKYCSGWLQAVSYALKIRSCRLQVIECGKIICFRLRSRCSCATAVLHQRGVELQMAILGGTGRCLFVWRLNYQGYLSASKSTNWIRRTLKQIKTKASHVTATLEVRSWPCRDTGGCCSGWYSE
jgi:hypothetical protein